MNVSFKTIRRDFDDMLHDELCALSRHAQNGCISSEFYVSIGKLLGLYAGYHCFDFLAEQDRVVSLPFDDEEV